jgi:hypothetical protein
MERLYEDILNAPVTSDRFISEFKSYNAMKEAVAVLKRKRDE